MLATCQTIFSDKPGVPCALHRQSHILIGRSFGISVCLAVVPLSVDRLSELCQLGLAVLCFSERRRSYSVCQVWHELLRVAKTALTDIEALSPPAHEVFGIERRVPWLDLDIAQDDVQHVRLGWRLFGRCLMLLGPRLRGHCSGHVVD
jgi:hypothetical protein